MTKDKYTGVFNRGQLVVCLENCLVDVSKKTSQLVPEKTSQSSLLKKCHDCQILLQPRLFTSSEQIKQLSDNNIQSFPPSNCIKESTGSLILQASLSTGLLKEGVFSNGGDLLPCKKSTSECDAEISDVSEESRNFEDLMTLSEFARQSSFKDDWSKSSEIFQNSSNLRLAQIPDEKLLKRHNCKELQVQLFWIKPTLHQMQALRHQNIFKTSSGKDFRHERLRPKGSLRQFIPFMYEQAATSNRRRRLSHLGTGYSTQKKHLQNPKKHIFRNKDKKSKIESKQKKNLTKLLLKIALKKKKMAMKERNTYANSLNSINQRINRQNYFWLKL